MFPFILPAVVAIALVAISRSPVYDWSKEQLLGKEQQPIFHDSADWEAAVSHICIVYQQLLASHPPGTAVPTFYDELGISAPQPGQDKYQYNDDGGRDGLDNDGVRSSAWAKLQALLRGNGERETTALAVVGEQLLGSEKAGGEQRRKGGGGDGSGVRGSLLVYEVLADEKRRHVYDRHFMPSLTSRWVDSAAFLREVCVWDR